MWDYSDKKTSLECYLCFLAFSKACLFASPPHNVVKIDLQLKKELIVTCRTKVMWNKFSQQLVTVKLQHITFNSHVFTIMYSEKIALTRCFFS